jgi:hypothetical protein
MRAGYVRNIASNPRVRLRLRSGILARWHTGTAHLLAEDDLRGRGVLRWPALHRHPPVPGRPAAGLFKECLVDPSLRTKSKFTDQVKIQNRFEEE